MAEGPSPTKKSKTDDAPLPECPYGTKCYRKNPQHYKEYAHSSGGSTTVTDSVTAKPVADDNRVRPPCKYGSNCYRKNLLHFAEFSHPLGSSKGKDSGSDTDVYDSGDDEPNTDGKKKLVNDSLTLVKRYSEMTDQERKELIEQAMKEKQKLKTELELAKKKMKEKEKELEHLSQQLNGGLLLMEGEEEAMKKNTTTYFPLWAERNYKEGSASQMHFRLAESQFYRLVTGGRYIVSKVEYVVTPKLVEKFRHYKKELKNKRGEKYADAVLAFHGTQVKNIVPICENGFRMPGDAAFKHRTDSGFYGAGVYFSEFPSYSMGYVHGANKLMLCQVLPGKVYTCDSIIMGAARQKGFDSHMSPCKNELIIFDSAAILPCYIIYYNQNANGVFQYEHKETVETTTALAQYQDAIKAAPTKVFSGKTITLSGKLVTSQAEIYKLIAAHGGKKGTTYEFDILVASKAKVVEGFSRDVLTAVEEDLPIVPESYLYQCIIQKKRLKPHNYVFDVLPDNHMIA